MDCPHIPYLEYGNFSRRLVEKVANRRVPLSGSLELSLRCNLRCQHCYVSHGHNGIPGEHELTTDEWRRVLDEIVDAGTLWLLITGGDPMVRRDFPEIYTYAKRKGLLLTVFTNGTLVTPRIADLLTEWRPFTVEITLYGYTQKTYEKVTGIPGSHTRVMRGIELLLERNIPLKLKTMLLTLNQHELGEMKAFANRLGMALRFDPMVNAGLEGDGSPVNLRLSPEEILKFDLQDPVRVAEWHRFRDGFAGKSGNPDFLYQCGAGVNSYHIDPYGKLSLCMISRAPNFDLRCGSFQQGWAEALPPVRYQPSRGEYLCSQCDLLPLCGTCPGWSNLEHGDPQGKVDFLCRVAHLRAEAFHFVPVEKIV